MTFVHVYRLYSLTCACVQSVLCDLYMCTVCTLWPVQVYSLYSLTCASVQSVLSDLYCESSLYSLTCVHVYSLYSLTCTACPVSWQRPCPSSSPATHSSTNGTNSSYNKRPSYSGDGKWTNTQQVPSPRFREIFCPFNKIVFLAPFPYSSPTSIVRFKMQMNKKKTEIHRKEEGDSRLQEHQRTHPTGWPLTSVSDPYSLNPDPAQNLNPDSSYFLAKSENKLKITSPL